MNSSLRELSDIEYGASPKEIRADDKTPVSIYGTSGFLGYATKSLFNGPLVVVARKGTLDNPIYVKGDCWVIDTTFAVLPKPDVEAKWLYYQLSNYDLKKLNESTGVPSINREYLYRLSFGNPGVTHQRKIARILYTADEVIKQTEGIIEKLKKIKQGMVHDLFTRGIDVKTGEFRPPKSEAPGLYKQTELGWIPKEWDAKPLEDLVDILDNMRIPLNEDQRSGIPGEIPYYGANGVQGYICKYLFDEPLILIAEDGGYFDEYSTRPIAYRIFGKSWVNNHAHVLKAKKEYIQDYIFFSLEHENILPSIKGGTRTKLNQAELRLISLSVPQLIDEQKLIACRLNSIEAFLLKQSECLFKNIKIKQGLMQDLLTGKVEVAPDPQDKEYQGANG